MRTRPELKNVAALLLAMVLAAIGLTSTAHAAAPTLEVGSRVWVRMEVTLTAGQIIDVQPDETTAGVAFDFVTRNGSTGSGEGDLVINTRRSGLLGNEWRPLTEGRLRARVRATVTGIDEDGTIHFTGTGSVSSGCIEVDGEAFRLGNGTTSWLPPICRNAPIAGPATLQVGSADANDTDD